MAKELNKKQIKDEKNKKSFGKDFKSELKKVVWPKPAELFKSTLAVIAIVILISVIVFCLDFAFEIMNKYGIDKLKNITQTTEENNTETELEEDTQTQEPENEENTQEQNSNPEAEVQTQEDGNTEAEENNVQ